MIIIACVDDENGMMFNHRRQSRDEEVLKDIAIISKESNLYMNAYSYSLFQDRKLSNIVVTSDFLKKEDTEAYYFIEDSFIAPFKNKVEQLILYRWNRKYPADFYFDFDLKKGWILSKTKEFKGNSHEKITKEIYVK